MRFALLLALVAALCAPSATRAQERPADGRGVARRAVPGLSVEGTFSIGDSTVADSIETALALPVPAALEAFGRLARLRLPAGAIAARETGVLRRSLDQREQQIAAQWLGVRDGRSPPSRLTIALLAPPDVPVRILPVPAPTNPANGPLIAVGDYADLSLRLNARLETKAEQLRTSPCLTIQLASQYQGCRSPFAPNLDFQFNVQSGGVVADRVHVNVDYDSKREFDASNNVSVYYEGKANEMLQRLEVGSVSFAPPPSRFITAGIPSGNYGLQAIGQVGPMRFRAIAAQQKGNIVRDARFTVGDRTERAVDRDIEDYQVEPRRFFFTVDPAQFANYPNIDILNHAQMTALSGALDSVRPSRVLVYRLQIGSQPANPNGPKFKVDGLTTANSGDVPYELLRQDIDYYIDPSLLWIALSRQASLDRDRIVVAYYVNVKGKDTINVAAGGTPDVAFVDRAPTGQIAKLLYDPSIKPGDAAFRREIRSVYRIGGDEVRRSSVTARIVAGAGGDQEKPTQPTAPSGTPNFQTYLEMFGLAQPTSPASFDAENRVWPRPSDPNVSVSAAGGTTRTIRDYFIVLPSLKPFSLQGLVVPGNQANDTIYTTPSEYLYSTQHPASVYRMRVRYQAEGSGDPGSLMLGAVQIRRNSERIIVDGVPLARGTDYAVDYELGRVTFTRPDTLFPQPRQVTVQYEENPVFATSATNVFGIAATFPSPQGELTFTAISQSQKTQYNRPPLGFEPASSLVAGVSGNWLFDASLLSSALGRLPLSERPGDSRIAIQAELATSRPQPNSIGQAWIETFEGESGVQLSTLDPSWFLSSRPPETATTNSVIGPGAFSVPRAATLVWQTNVSAPTPNGPDQAVFFTPSRIDPRIKVTGVGQEPTESILWLTLFPTSTGFVRDRNNGRTEWLTGASAPAQRRWRSIRTVLSPSGTDLTRAEELQFWAIVDTRPATRNRNPTLIVDLGEISENTLALAPDSLIVSPTSSGVDSLYTGRHAERLDTLDTERDSITRSFNAAQNDSGIPPDVVRNLPVRSGGTVRTQRVDLCEAQFGIRLHIGDQGANCSVRNNRLDEEDIDLDFQLNFANAGSESFSRYVVNLADPASYSRRGQCSHSMTVPDVLPDAEYCWVLIRVPLKLPSDTLNVPQLRRTKALRLTMVSGAGVPDDSVNTVPIARLRLAGPPWLKRSDVPLAGIGGDSAAVTVGSVVTASLIGTTDEVYQRPPGVIDEGDTKISAYQQGVTQINESSLRLRAVNVPQYSRAEAFYRFPEGAKSFLGYRELRVWARGGTLSTGRQSSGWGENGELEFFVRIGRDANNFYLYRTTAQTGNSEAAWKDVRVDFGILQALRARIQNAYLGRGNRIDCTDSTSLALIARTPLPPLTPATAVYAACDRGYIAYTISPGVTPPNLASVQELSVGMVRVRMGTGTNPIGIANDTLDLWVDDVRLRNVVDTPGYAGQIGLNIAAGGIADLRLVASKRDPYFRQLAEQPSFVGDAGLDLAATVRVDRLLPGALGIVLPLTIAHSGSSGSPELLAQSDVTASSIPGLRTPRSSATSYALSARRITPMENPIASAILDNVTLNGTWATSDARSEYQVGGANNWNVGVDYVVAAEPRATAIPAWVKSAIGVLPPWIRESELGRAIRGASLRWNPAAIRFTSALARSTDERRTFLKPAADSNDQPQIVNGENHVWRNAAGIELRPAAPLTLRWDATSLRDLRAYSGDERRSLAARRERAKLFGTDVGLERERQMSAAVTFAPPVSVWLHPRLDLGSTFSFVRDPNAATLVYPDTAKARLDSTIGVLPRRFGNTQALNASAQLDLQRAARVYFQTNRLLRALGNAIAPIDVTFNRSLISAFDDQAFSPSLGYQFALGGAGSMRRIRDRPATSAGLTNTLSANGALVLPLDFALVSRLGKTNSRSWSRRTEDRQDVVDGVQLDFPDLTLRWSFVPSSGTFGKLASNLFRSVGTNIGLRNTRVSSVAQFGTVPDARISRIRTYPANATVGWALGDLTTSLGYAWTVRDDSLPGSATHGTTGERTLDVGRSWALPASWKTRSPLRTRLSYQDARTMSVLADSRRRLADNARNVFSLSADTDVNETMTFSLQGSRTVTIDRNYNRRLTQNVLTAALQLQFFSGELK